MLASLFGQVHPCLFLARDEKCIYNGEGRRSRYAKHYLNYRTIPAMRVVRVWEERGRNRGSLCAAFHTAARRIFIFRRMNRGDWVVSI